MAKTIQIATETRKSFQTAIGELSTCNAEKKRKGEIRINQIPKEERIFLLSEAWTKAKKLEKRRLRFYLICLAIGIIAGVCIFGHVIKLPANDQSRKDFNSYLQRFLIQGIWQVPLQIGVSGLSGMLFGFGRGDEKKNLSPVLRTLDSPQVVPLMLESLTVDDNELTRQQLARLLPDFLAADLPSLTAEQQKIVRREIKKFADKLRFVSRSLADWETEYLIGLLNLLQMPRQTRERKETKHVLSDIAELMPLGATTGEYISTVVQETQKRLTVQTGDRA